MDNRERWKLSPLLSWHSLTRFPRAEKEEVWNGTRQEVWEGRRKCSYSTEPTLNVGVRSCSWMQRRNWSEVKQLRGFSLSLSLSCSSKIAKIGGRKKEEDGTSGKCEKSDLDLASEKKKREKEGGREIGKGEGSNLGVESCSRNLIPNTKKANFNEIQDRLWINLNLALSNFFELTPWEMKFGLEVVKSSSFKGQHQRYFRHRVPWEGVNKSEEGEKKKKSKSWTKVSLKVTLNKT